MTATCLRARHLEKVWGRSDLPDAFQRASDAGALIGEVVYDHPDAAEAPLLVKYLFTSERLSVQVHPDDAAAARAGLRSGKDEAWLVIAAEPGAEIATGLNRAVSPEELRAAALDGSIVDLLDWQQVCAGDCLYSPAGTIHAIGAGVSAVEIQQNEDVTYRLYDYGRPRELHLEEALAVARLVPGNLREQPVMLEPGRTLIASGPKLTVERLEGAGSGMLPASEEAPIWLIPRGHGLLGNEAVAEGEVWLLDAPRSVMLPADSSLLVATQGKIAEDYWRR